MDTRPLTDITPTATLEDLLARLEVDQVSFDALVTLEVVVEARRVRGSGLAFFSGTMVADGSATRRDIQLVLDLRRWGGSSRRFDEFVELMRPGAVVRCAGGLGCDRPGQASLYVTSALLRAIAFDGGVAPCSIARIARCVDRGDVTTDEAAAALHCDAAAVLELVRLTNEAAEVTEGEEDARAAARTRLKRAVAALARSAAGLPPGREPPRRRPPLHSTRDLATLAAAEAVAPPFPTAPPLHSAVVIAPLLHPASCLAFDPSAPCSRQTAAVRTRGEYLQVKKAPQVAWIVEQLAALLQRLGRPPPYRILDGCGGRGDVAIAAAFAIPGCLVTVVDVNEQALDAGRARAAAAGVAPGALSFVCADVEAWAATGEPCDVIIGLHACGGLTDTLLLAATTRLSCAFLVVPCCYGKHGGGGREDWAHPLATPLDSDGVLAAAVLCRLAESPDRAISVRAQMAVAALRLAAVQRLVLARHGGGDLRDPAGCPGGADAAWRLELATFDDAASLRNLALIGAPGPSAVSPLERDAVPAVVPAQATQTSASESESI